VQLGHELVAIDIADRALHFTGGATVPFDRAVYTLPLHLVAQLVDGAPPAVVDACTSLRYQGILCVNVAVSRPHLSHMHWIYYYEDAFPFHRLSFPANFSPENVPEGKSSISVEVAYKPEEPLDEDALVAQTIAGLIRAGVLGGEDEIEFVDARQIAPAYVIYDLDHAGNVATIRDWLAEQQIFAAGRFGEWQYLNMDHAMRSGREVARSLLAGRTQRGPD
jgi:protoporphyrinogen oxidase